MLKKIYFKTLKNMKFYRNEFKFFTEEKNSNKEELKNLKSSLQSDKKSILEKMTNILDFKKNNVVFHTDKFKKNDLNTINNQDLQKVNEFYEYKQQHLNMMIVKLENVENLLEKIAEIKNISVLIGDNRFKMLCDDIIFLTNTCKNPKILSKLLGFSFIFLQKNYDKEYIQQENTFQDYVEKVADRLFHMLEMTEISEMLIFVKFFNDAKNKKSMNLLVEPFRTEIIRRLDKEYYLKTQMDNPFIENDQFVLILSVYEKANLLDEDLIKLIFKYIIDNLDTFSLKDLSDISLFFVNGEYNKIFLSFFDNIFYKKIKRNIKIMNLPVLYDYTFLLCKINYLKDYKKIDTLFLILDSLLQNDTLNKELNEYLIFQSNNTDLITKFILLFKNEELDEKIRKNEEFSKKIKKIEELTIDYFIVNFNKFSLENKFLILNNLSIEKEIFIKLTNNLYQNLNSMNENSLIKFCDFYISNDNVIINKTLLRELSKIYEKKLSLKINVKILMLFTKKNCNLEEYIENQNPYKIMQDQLSIENNIKSLNLNERISLIWSLSFMKNRNDFPFDKILQSNIHEIKNLKIFEIMLIIQSIRNFNKEKLISEKYFDDFNQILLSLEDSVINNLKEFTLIEFLAIVNTYSTNMSNKCPSNNFIKNISELAINSIEQYSVFHLEILISDLEKILKKSSKETTEYNITTLEILKRLKAKLEIKILEKSVEDISGEVIRESIREYIKTEKEKNKDKENFKKLI